MSEHHATIDWRRTSESFDYDSYNREHQWRFGSDTEGAESGGGAIRVAASAAPAFRGLPGNVDPEEAFVAALASCHMLTFLALAARRRLSVDEYIDEAVGTLEKNEAGKLAITRVILRPRVRFTGGESPSGEQLAKLHDKAHHECFIANSVRTQIVVE